VVGGTRFIGPHVVRFLEEAGHEVTVYHRGHHEPPLPDAVAHIHSEEAGIPVLRFPREVEPDVLLHMIPMGLADAQAAVEAFRGRAGRIVAVSSGDVYRAYGRFLGIEPGPIEQGLLTETSPLRSVLYPHRSKAASPEALEFYYEKILVEKTVLEAGELAGTVLRLPKVYGQGRNRDLATMYGARGHPQWRWTHGYVENVAWAIALAVLKESAAGGIYNVGEAETPTVEERLHGLPERDMPLFPEEEKLNFAQDMAYDTTLIRERLGFRELISYEEGLRRTLGN
jgi:nucleoside-diphosphate-sugar epimerase